ncbi:hypothetical protein [Pseudomonas sp. HLT2-19-2]
MLMRLLVKPGDTVLLDDPCYFTMHTNLALHGVRVAPGTLLSKAPNASHFLRRHYWSATSARCFSSS